MAINLPRRLPAVVASIAVCVVLAAQGRECRRAGGQSPTATELKTEAGVAEAIKQLSADPSSASDGDAPPAAEKNRKKGTGKKNGATPTDAGDAPKSLPISASPTNEEKQDLGATARAMARGVFLVGGEAGTGSAWVLSKEHRLLVTNAHVADIRHASGGKMVAVPNGTATVYEVEKVWYHPGVRRFFKGHKLSVRSSDPDDGEVDSWSPDVAILQLGAAGADLEVEFTPATAEELASLFAQPVAIMGFPGHDTHGLPAQGETAAATFHNGVVSRLTDFQFGTGTPAAHHQFVQYTMSTWNGFSGSPVFLANGHVACVHNNSNFDRRGDEVRSIPHGVRVDCVLEMLVHHGLEDLVSFKFDKDALDIERWIEPDPRTERALADVAKAGALVDEGNALYDQGNYMEAAKKCGEALEVLPTYAPALTTRAGIFYVAWLKSDGWEAERAMTVLNQALNDATRANQLTPGLEILLQMGRIRNAMTWETDDDSHSRKVIDALNELLKDEKTLDMLSRASTLQVRGNSYNLTDQNDLALVDFNECVRLDPKNPGRYEARGRFLQSVGRSGEASADFLYADKLRGEGVEVWWEGKWYPAEILKTYGNQYYIHYKGYGAEWDEWVSYSRVRVDK
ncbi:MAG: trypsin-like peptidase domain-containing protein [Planctomycetaceae bacterium]|nr:trypsin-like peptidase domain-containing protein [Planctomycetaceae bacterium]